MMKPVNKTGSEMEMPLDTLVKDSAAWNFE
jgi:hypothetical protein